MISKHAGIWLLVGVIAVSVMVFKRTVHAENWFESLNRSSLRASGDVHDGNKHVEDDQATAIQLQEDYANHRQALDRAYSSNDWQKIQNLQTAMNKDVQRIRAKAQELDRRGMIFPYAIPEYDQYSQGSGSGAQYQQWKHRVATSGQELKRGQKTGWNGREAPKSGWSDSDAPSAVVIHQWDEEFRQNRENEADTWVDEKNRWVRGSGRHLST